MRSLPTTQKRNNKEPKRYCRFAIADDRFISFLFQGLWCHHSRIRSILQSDPRAHQPPKGYVQVLPGRYGRRRRRYTPSYHRVQVPV
jgi:hypothetical protein